MVIKMYAIFARETLRQMQFEGKLAAQAGHAYLHAWWDAESRLMYDRGLTKNPKLPADHEVLHLNPYGQMCQRYRNDNDARKVSLVVDTVKELRELYDIFRPHMGATLVEDCGYTVFDKPTITAVGLGPIASDWTKGTCLGDLDTLKNEIHV